MACGIYANHLYGAIKVLRNILFGIAGLDRVARLAWNHVAPFFRAFLVSDVWTRHDPDPSTLQNEFRDEYLKRVEYATIHYRGFVTDRGRGYVRYGRPDEILTLRKSADPLVEKPSSGISNFEQLWELIPRESSTHSSPREPLAENFNIELWLYYRLSEHQTPPSPFDKFGAKRVKFVFAGSDDFGRLRKVYSTELELAQYANSTVILCLPAEGGNPTSFRRDLSAPNPPPLRFGG